MWSVQRRTLAVRVATTPLTLVCRRWGSKPVIGNGDSQISVEPRAGPALRLRRWCPAERAERWRQQRRQRTSHHRVYHIVPLLTLRGCRTAQL